MRRDLFPPLILTLATVYLTYDLFGSGRGFFAGFAITMLWIVIFLEWSRYCYGRGRKSALIARQLVFRGSVSN